jgi:hypothetical protein
MKPQSEKLDPSYTTAAELNFLDSVMHRPVTLRGYISAWPWRDRWEGIDKVAALAHARKLLAAHG